MTYCNIQDIKDRIPEVTRDYVSDSTVYMMIKKAQSEIDSYLKGIYDVPFDDSDVPELIKDLCADIATVKIMLTFPDANFDEDLNRLLQFNEKRINNLRKGKMKLDDNHLVNSGMYSSTGFFCSDSREDTVREDYSDDTMYYGMWF